MTRLLIVQDVAEITRYSERRAYDVMRMLARGPVNGLSMIDHIYIAARTGNESAGL